MVLGMKKKNIAFIFACVILGIGCMGGCGNNRDEKISDSQNVGKTTESIPTNKSEYMGITFSYIVEEDSAIITNISPESGEKLIFPEEIDGYKVVDLHKFTMDYKDVKFATVESGSGGINENTVIERVSFYENVSANTYKLLEKCSNVKEVEFPKGLKVVDNWLEGKQSLEKVILSDTIVTINKKAFKKCSSLKDINLGNISKISDEAFAECKSLKSLDFSSVYEIGSKAFFECTGLNEDIVFTKLVVDNLGANSFNGCTGLNGRTVTFEKECTITDLLIRHRVSDGEAPFKNISVNIVGLGSKDDIMRLTASGASYTQVSFSGFYLDTSPLGDIGHDSVKCTPEKFQQVASECFDNIILKPGEELELLSLKKMYDQIKDEGCETHTDPHLGYSAAKYRVTDALTQFLTGKEIETTVTDISDSGWVRAVKYDTINFDSYTILNETGRTIQFCVDIDSENLGFSLWAYYID